MKNLGSRRGGGGGGERKPIRCRLISVGSFVSGVACFWLVVYAATFTAVFHKLFRRPDQLRNNFGRHATEKRTYEDWRNIAVELAKLPAPLILGKLNKSDPFGVRTFHAQLLERESQKGASLELDELKSIFSCPMNDRITLPDQRDNTKSKAYRDEVPGTFLFFQHLRKAGGTNFCTLAKDNLPKSAVSPYYCMGDWFWVHDDGRKADGAGYLQHWTNDEITSRMSAARHRVIGNEWDNFDRFRHFDLPAVFATSFRRPMDRALSQFRFECIEDRGCKIKDVGVWWEHRKDLYNIYTRTFATVDVTRKLVKEAFEGDSAQDEHWRAKLIGDALDTVIRFHVVLTMEWLAYAKPVVETVLAFHNTTSLTLRVRPHINLRKREDGQDVNVLGAAGIAKASWTPENYLTPEQYKQFSTHLALDEILTDAAQRIFLERLVCDDMES